MATWSFRDALEELEVKGCFDKSMLRSNVGLRLGNICFAEIQTTLKMCMVHFSTFIRFIEQGCFNANKLSIDGCSQTMAILLAFIHIRRLEDIESIGISNVIQRCGRPIGDLSSITMVIDSIRSVLDTEHKKIPMKCRVLIGNYGRHMAFATDPPYCVAYSTDYKTNDPSQMTPHHTQNHMYAMVTTNMIVRRLLSSPHWEPMYSRQTKGGCLLIPRGMQFGPTLFPEIVIPRNHVGSTCRFSHAAGGPVLNCWALSSHRYYFPWFPRGSRIVYCQGSGQVEGVGGFEPSQRTRASAALSTTCIPQSG